MGKAKRKVEEDTCKPVKRSATKKVKINATDRENMPIVKRLKSFMHIKYSELPVILQIGYPCINWTENCTTGHTIRMSSFSREKILDTVKKNIDDFSKMLQFNLKHKIFFFRIGSPFIPFASHPNYQGKVDWVSHFQKEFTEIGEFIKSHKMRMSMHPDQFVLINSPKQDVQDRSVAELEYHCNLLDALKLDQTHKVQIHVGGVYNDKKAAMKRFIERYQLLSSRIRERLVIENDDKLFSLKDCLQIHSETGIPILFDNLHHECLNSGESLQDALKLASETWIRERDGVPLMDYSSQEKGARKGKHAEHIDLKHFKQYLGEFIKSGVKEADIMLEIKDKETSALEAIVEYISFFKTT